MTEESAQTTQWQERTMERSLQAARQIVGATIDIPETSIDADWPALASLQAGPQSGPIPFGQRVESVLYQLALSGECTADKVATFFAIRERTLRRLLREEDKSLRELIGRTRYELARQLLSNTSMPVSEIAAALHYTDPNAFSRAFRGWADLSPAQWREAERGATIPPER